MDDDTTTPDAWQELRDFADTLEDDLIVLPQGLEADEPHADDASDTRSLLDAYDELRSIGGGTRTRRSTRRR